MISPLKLAIVLAVFIQLGLSSAFVPHNILPSVQVNHVRSISSLSVSASTPTPTKLPDVEIASDVTTEERTGRDPMWLVR